MNPVVWAAASVIVAFWLGSIPFGYLVARWKGVDIRAVGSGNIGATNVGRTLGRNWGFGVFGLDFLKGAAAAGSAVGLRVVGDVHADAMWMDAGLVAAGLAGVLGHNYSPWLGGRGGKGIATSAGVLSVLFPVALAWSLAAFGVGVLGFGFISLGSILAAMTLSVSGLILYGPSINGLACLMMGAVAVARHRSNLYRLLQGTEPKVLWKKENDAALDGDGPE